MALGEFELIERYFRRPVQRAALGVGDDCALLQPTPGWQMAVSSDLLVEGRHFLSTVDPARLGHKALAVNLSDLAACGARPLAFTLALSLPRAEEAFLAPLSRGLLALADAHGIELVGGDTTAGPLSLCITVMGEVPAGQALLRAGPGRGTRSGSAAVWAMPGWRWRRFAAAWRCRPRAGPRPGGPWRCPSRGWPWARPCGAWPAPPST